MHELHLCITVLRYPVLMYISEQFVASLRGNTDLLATDAFRWSVYDDRR